MSRNKIWLPSFSAEDLELLFDKEKRRKSENYSKAHRKRWAEQKAAKAKAVADVHRAEREAAKRAKLATHRPTRWTLTYGGRAGRSPMTLINALLAGMEPNRWYEVGGMYKLVPEATQSAVRSTIATEAGKGWLRRKPRLASLPHVDGGILRRGAYFYALTDLGIDRRAEAVKAVEAWLRVQAMLD